MVLSEGQREKAKAGVEEEGGGKRMGGEEADESEEGHAERKREKRVRSGEGGDVKEVEDKRG